ncbi:RhoGAP [Fasciola gigantica]|uniref:RhoGAP n=1 Tax=Fasciola gigantica TaxID=46835 RepID=A0A504Z570_FASGI|nr:RhoGAP [Fasciola gigantica]
MLQRAAHLLSATQKEEAWHLVGLYQQTQPRGFLHICHRILASFLELTHDYFDQGWPLVTRLTQLAPTTTGTQRSRRHRRNRIKTITDTQNSHWSHEELNADVLMDEIDMSSVYHNHVCMSPVHHLVTYCTALFPACTSETETSVSTPKHVTGLGKLRTTLAAKRLLKQILPSRPRTPSTAKLACMDPIPGSQNQQHANTNPSTTSIPTIETSRVSTKMTGQVHTGSISTQNGTRVPLAPIHVSHPSTSTPVAGMRNSTTRSCPSRTMFPPTDSCCNTDSLICRCLIEYMLDNPALNSVEGLFRVPGNAQRIRDLWLSLRGFFQTPYIRMPQPEPECGLECDIMSTRWDLYSLLDAYSPHDLATLLLRCLTTCSQASMTPVFNSTMAVSSFGSVGSTSVAGGIASGSGTSGVNENTRTSYQFASPDETGLYSSVGGLIHPEAGGLCFLATQLQYGLEQVRESDMNEDWMQMLCQARQLLTYRIVLQLLLPNPERMILFDLLRLFKQVSQNQANSRMSAECLARCTAVAVFGAPVQVTMNMNHPSLNSQPHPWSVDSPLRWRIDTLTNLINMADDLNHLPGIVYSAVRDRLRIRLGHSPISRVPVAVTGWCGKTSSKSSLARLPNAPRVHGNGHTGRNFYYNDSTQSRFRHQTSTWCSVRNVQLVWKS